MEYNNFNKLHNNVAVKQGEVIHFQNISLNNKNITQIPKYFINTSDQINGNNNMNEYKYIYMYKKIF